MRRVACWTLTLLLVACGEARAPEPEVAAATSGDEGHVAVAACVDRTHGGCVTRADPPAPSANPPAAQVPPPQPIDRSDRAGPTSEPELASAEAAYAQLAAMAFGLSTPPPTAQAGITELVGQIQRASRIAQQVAASCGTAAAGAVPLRVSALTLQADAYDFLAAHIASASVLLPIGLAWPPATPQVQAQVAAQFQARVTDAFAARVAPIYCLAVQRYQLVLTMDAVNARATEQLAAYGEPFVRSCVP